MVSYNGHHQFNSRIPECLPSFEWLAHGKPNNGRQACLVSRLSSPSPLGRKSSVDFDGRPPKFSTIFHFFYWRWLHDELGGCDDVPNEYVIVVSKTKLAGSIIIQNTRHEITRWWRPPASTGKVLTYLWPNRRAHARSVLPRWPPWLFWSRLGLIPGVSGKCQDFRLFVDFENFHPLFQYHFTFVKY